MKSASILKKTRIFRDSTGKPDEALIPYEAYTELLEAKISQEIFVDKRTQSSLKRAYREVKNGQFQDFNSALGLIGWLKKK